MATDKRMKRIFLKGGIEKFMIKRFCVILGMLILGVMSVNPHVSDPFTLKDDKPAILHAFALLLLISFLTARVYTHLNASEIRRIIKYATIWLCIFLAVAVAHSYRFELVQVKNKVLANLFPGRSFEKMPGTMSFQISPNGHFYIQAMVNGIPLRFLADTGASHIVLTPKAGKKLGFNLDQISFDRTYQTANGMGRGASVRLTDMKIGELRLRNVRASINESPMSHSLLGMSFFNRLKGYKVKNGVLTLY
ncbi:MAG TPA: TIGR02281 family clan AA aspartic protease, partial [Desulfobacterales bacterium]|nr:TIGR02281 family clan AA aspartic protease [Desulfobacterales bacterium]